MAEDIVDLHYEYVFRKICCKEIIKKRFCPVNPHNYVLCIK